MGILPSVKCVASFFNAQQVRPIDIYRKMVVCVGGEGLMVRNSSAVERVCEKRKGGSATAG